MKIWTIIGLDNLPSALFDKEIWMVGLDCNFLIHNHTTLMYFRAQNGKLNHLYNKF